MSIAKNGMFDRSAGKATRKFRLFAGAVAVAAISACTSAQAPVQHSGPDFTVPQRWASFSRTAPRMHDTGWLASFNSATLTNLVNEALANNRDLRIANAALQESRAVARQAGAPLLPTVGATYTSNRTGSDQTNTSSGGRGEFEINWELDLWGRIRGERAAAGLDAVAQAALFEYTRQSIAAQVAENWFIVNGNRQLLSVANREVQARRRALNDISERVDEQTLLAVDRNWAAAELARAEERRAEAEGAVSESVRALEVLLGRYPAAEVRGSSALPGLPHRIPQVLPARLLERRPDVVAAERQVAAAYHRHRSARAALLPQFNLKATLGHPNGNLSNAVNPSTWIWTVAGDLFAPIFQGGVRRENIVIANARQEAAFANYGKVALTAFQEVENGLTNERILRRRLHHLQSAENQLRRAIELETERFELSEIGIARLDEARLRFFDVQRERINVRVALLTNRVRLHLALGGSFRPVRWVPASEAAAAAETAAEES